jgi:hypothetical protein
MIIMCKYSCFKCGIYRRAVNVKAREDEDIDDWLENTCALVLSRDHDSQSPNCHITKLDEVLIPTPEGIDKIGGLTRN